MNKRSVGKQQIQKENSDYEKQINKFEKEIRRLKSEVRILQEALATTDEYLADMVKDKTVEDVVQNVKNNADIVLKEKCPNCGTDEMKQINLGTIRIIKCTRCSYRNRLNESGPVTT